MLGTVLTILTVAWVSSFAASIVHDHIEIILPTVFNSLLLFFYCFGLLGNLAVGFPIMFLLLIASGVYAWKRKKIREIIASLQSPAPMVWIIATIGLCLLLSPMHMWAGDDLCHWGLVVKDLFYRDSFTISSSGNVFFTEYPQLSGLSGYIFNKMNFRFQDSLILVSLGSWGVSLLMPIFKGISKKNVLEILAAGLIAVLGPLCVGYRYTIYNSATIDRVMGVAFAFNLACVFILEYNSRSRVLFQVVNLSAMTLMKSTGLFLAIIVLLIDFIYRFKRPEINKHFFSTILRGIVVWMVSWTWTLYVRLHDGINWLYRDGIQNIGLLDVLKGNGSEVQNQALEELLDRFFNLKYFQFGWNRSFLAWTIIAIVGLMLLCRLEHVKLKKTLSLLSAVLISEAGWWFGTVYVILVTFTDEIMLYANSYERYLDDFFLGIVFCEIICAFCAFRKNYTAKKPRHYMVIATTFVLLGIMTFYPIAYNSYYIYSTRDDTNTIDQLRYVLTDVEKNKLSRASIDKDRVYIIAQNEGLSAKYYFALYDVAPLGANTQLSYNRPGDLHVSYCIGDPYDANDKRTTNYGAEEFSDILEDYTYLLIADYDNSFVSRYGLLFNGRVIHGLYQVKHDASGKLFLDKV